MQPRKKQGRAFCPSSALCFLSVATDGRQKARHNQEVMFILSLLQKSGIRNHNIAHIDDAGINREIPIAKAGKNFDIGYQSADGEIFLIEVMRLGKVQSARRKKG
ncbi:MAG: hypothetical protein Q8J76_10960 [Desulfobulbaceae bacterium]|nr:hypothetical protein [Desulfobulbaceae bacterium]